MSQEFRLSIKNFSQRKIVNVKDIFKNLSEQEKEILEREKKRAEDKVIRAFLQQNEQTLNRSKRIKHTPMLQSVTSIRKSRYLDDKKSLLKNSEISKSSVQFPSKQNDSTTNNNITSNNNNNNNIRKPNKYKVVNYDETLNNRPWMNAYSNSELNDDKSSYEESFKRYISQIDLNLNRILNEKKINKNDFELIHKMTLKKPPKPYRVLLRKDDDYSSNFLQKQPNDEEKMNKFNGFKKKIKNLFASDERLDNAFSKKQQNDQPRQVHIIRLKESSKLNKKNSSSQYFSEEIINNCNNSEPYFVDRNKNKWNNYSKNFSYMNQNQCSSSPSNEAFINQSENKFKKLSNLLSKTKNLLH